uniref:Mitochondrial carrier protein n=1 Tax=Rhodosorus marinus TaxID=101924 RepID=A0A7S2ZNN5_9RHOD|mmetsp:Transcript_26559/g.103418  ORF Transcript_26559/g.103418 Transcript_26559/m.103418 type:complete len:308 (+) Transcript_26559:184-1107(+)
MEDDDAEAKRHVVRDLLAGSIAAGTARMFVAPLDVVKIRFQVMDELSNGTSRSRLGSQKAYRSVGHAFNEIVQKEGFRALWKGNFPALFMIVPYGGIQFASYHYISRAIGNRVGEPYTSLIGGALSGMNATLFTYPLDLLRTRLAVQREPRMYKTFMDAVRTILADEGLRGFYAGVQPTLIEIVPYIALHFTFYEGLKSVFRRFHEDPNYKLNPVESLIAGGLSGLGSKILTLPLDTVKKRMQVQGQFYSETKYTGFLDVFQKVYRSDGLKGLFRGWQPSIIKAVPNSAITFAIFESAKQWLDKYIS